MIKAFDFFTSNFTGKTLFSGFLTQKCLDIAKNSFNRPFFVFCRFEITCVADKLY